eukprot:617083-Amphidinium_carterae.2
MASQVAEKGLLVVRLVCLEAQLLPPLACVDDVGYDRRRMCRFGPFCGFDSKLLKFELPQAMPYASWKA